MGEIVPIPMEIVGNRVGSLSARECVISESSPSTGTVGDRGVFQDVAVRARHRPRTTGAALATRRDVEEDQGMTGCVQRTSMGALGDPSGASDFTLAPRLPEESDVDCMSGGGVLPCPDTTDNLMKQRT